MHTLEQLRRGELAGATRLDLSAGLTEFPEEIFALSDTLEVLNLSGNQLQSLPANLSRLHKLRILFCSNNPFTEVPEVLGECSNLEMVGFKANRINHLPAAALSPALRWLILTDNQLQDLPEDLGNCSRLQKLMLAGNQLHFLPQSMEACHNLELLRIAANRLESLPGWLLELPRLSWLAFAGNPFSDTNEARTLAQHPIPPIARDSIELGEILGQGASGIIRRANWKTAARPMAAKLFKGSVTSDGLPHSEMAACIAAGDHHNLIQVVGPLEDEINTVPGLLMELIDPAFKVLAAPPSLASCTRDCYAEGQGFSFEQVLNIVRGVASVLKHLHRSGILHGDLYAHNLLVDEYGKCLLSDFGAASFFAASGSTSAALQRIETRAFGCLLEELLERIAPQDQPAKQQRMRQLQAECFHIPTMQRPDFATLSACLDGF